MFKEAIDLVNNSNTIYVVGHQGPDGDAIGSSFAVCLAMRKIGKKANVIMPKCSESFKFLPGIDSAVECVKEPEYDLLIAVDCSDKARLAILPEDYNKAKKVLMIDHHEKGNVYGDVQVIESTMPAACQITFDFLTALNIEIDKDIATYLYTGLMTDTGSFNYATTRPSTLIVAAKLIEKGIDFSGICQKLNHTIKEGKLRLISKTIDNMEVYFDGKLRYAYIDYETVKKLGLDDEESEGMTNYLKMVENTEVAAYVRQREDGSNKVSLRSNGNVDVSKIALMFDGGGHKRAAGYTMIDALDVEKEKLLNVVGEMLNDNTSK